MNDKKTWRVRHLTTEEREGHAGNPTTPYGKLFKEGVLIYLWVYRDQETAMGIGVVLCENDFNPKSGDTIELLDMKTLKLLDTMTVRRVRINGEKGEYLVDLFCSRETPNPCIEHAQPRPLCKCEDFVNGLADIHYSCPHAILNGIGISLKPMKFCPWCGGTVEQYKRHCESLKTAGARCDCKEGNRSRESNPKPSDTNAIWVDDDGNEYTSDLVEAVLGSWFTKASRASGFPDEWEVVWPKPACPTCPACGKGEHGVDALCEKHYKDYLGTHLGARSDDPAIPPPRPSPLDHVPAIDAATIDLKGSDGKLVAMVVGEVLGMSPDELIGLAGAKPEQLDTVLLYLERIARLRVLFYGKTALSAWLDFPNPALDGKAPRTMLKPCDHIAWQALADMVDDILVGSPT